MGVKVFVSGGESVPEALRRLKELMRSNRLYAAHYPCWYKRKPDYYLKPSRLRRRRALSDRLSCRLSPGSLWRGCPSDHGFLLSKRDTK
jgi:hypothetical protein